MGFYFVYEHSHTMPYFQVFLYIPYRRRNNAFSCHLMLQPTIKPAPAELYQPGTLLRTFLTTELQRQEPVDSLRLAKYSSQVIQVHKVLHDDQPV